MLQAAVMVVLTDCRNTSSQRVSGFITPPHDEMYTTMQMHPSLKRNLLRSLSAFTGKVIAKGILSFLCFIQEDNNVKNTI